MASTDIIAAAVQQEHGDVLELWQAVRRFALKLANRWTKAMGARCGQTVDDLMQAAFVALLDALDGWEADKGSFIGWYALRLKTSFSECYGLRTKRQREDPLNSFSMPLDEPITEDGNVTLADVIPDPLAEKPFDDLSLKIAIQNALAALPPEERRAIVGEFWHGQRADAKTRGAGLRHMRHPIISRSLKAYL